MKQLAKISMGVLLISLSVLSVKQANERYDLNLDIQNLLHINHAQAESGEGDCMDNGYKNWNSQNGGADGLDCLCVERERVENDCK